MNIEDFETMFRNEIMPNIREQENGVFDLPLRRQCWNDTIDFYIKALMLDESAGDHSLPDDLQKNPY